MEHCRQPYHCQIQHNIISRFIFSAVCFLPSTACLSTCHYSTIRVFPHVASPFIAYCTQTSVVKWFNKKQLHHWLLNWISRWNTQIAAWHRFLIHLHPLLISSSSSLPLQCFQWSCWILQSSRLSAPLRPPFSHRQTDGEVFFLSPLCWEYFDRNVLRVLRCHNNRC